jgi:hypothetical protein
MALSDVRVVEDTGLPERSRPIMTGAPLAPSGLAMKKPRILDYSDILVLATIALALVLIGSLTPADLLVP